MKAPLTMTTMASALAFSLGGLVSMQAKAAGPTADQVLEKYRIATYYAGKDFKARELLEIFTKDGKKRVREMTQVRRTPNPGEAYKSFIYFHNPDDVKRMAMIIWVDPKKADDRWVYVPAMDSIRRIAAMDERAKFVGSDFTYEDGSGHDKGAFTNKFLPDEKVMGRDCWVIESVPKKTYSYSKRVFWIDKKTTLALRYNYYNTKGQLWKVAESMNMKVIKAGAKLYPTHTKVQIKDLLSGGHSVFSYRDIVYDQNISDAEFTERQLRNPPREWIR